MTLEQAVQDLNAIDGGDPERAHSTADDVLLRYLRANGGAALADAYDAVVDRCGWWACACWGLDGHSCRFWPILTPVVPVGP